MTDELRSRLRAVFFLAAISTAATSIAASAVGCAEVQSGPHNADEHFAVEFDNVSLDAPKLLRSRAPWMAGEIPGVLKCRRSLAAKGAESLGFEVHLTHQTSRTEGLSMLETTRYHARMLKQLPMLAVAAAVGMPGALAESPAGEKKAELCLLCHRVDNSHGAPVLDALPASYLLEQFEFFKSGKRFGPAMQTNLSPLSSEDLRDIAGHEDGC